MPKKTKKEIFKDIVELKKAVREYQQTLKKKSIKDKPIIVKKKSLKKLSNKIEDDIEVREKKYHSNAPNRSNRITLEQAIQRNFLKDPFIDKNLEKYAMDSLAMDSNITPIQAEIGNPILSDGLLNWFAAQAFIGYQLCAILSQHWLIDKACTIPPKDSIRNGFELTINDGKKIDIKLLEKIKEYDIKYKLNENCVEFSRMARVFGVRIIMFKIETDNPQEFYSNPFNIDGVKPGTYKGMSQIDPYWITPELDFEASSDPSSIHYYEPTWWRVGDLRVHRTHLIVNIPFPVSDLLKPSYMYGGISLTQKIYERVYASERTANEAPLLAMTKRVGVLKLNSAAAIANQGGLEQRMYDWQFYRDNYGTKLIDDSEEYMQIDTSLADLDAIINTQYQIVAGIANTPVSKLMGITLKGFNSQGSYEEASYHEELKSIQTHEMSPLINRHHQLVIKSFIQSNDPFETTVCWNPLDLPSDEELAKLNKLKAETDDILSRTGSIDSMDIRNRVINDPLSGYNGMEEKKVDELNENLYEGNTEEHISYTGKAREY